MFDPEIPWLEWWWDPDEVLDIDISEFLDDLAHGCRLPEVHVPRGMREEHGMTIVRDPRGRV